MSTEELESILKSHMAWLKDHGQGTRADLLGADLHGVDLSGADLRYANLSDADLRGADLQDADLSEANLMGADLRGAHFMGANLQCADLCGADLRNADLRHANLTKADLRGSDLRGANLDYSSLPLWCGSLNIRIDGRIAAQLMYHVMRALKGAKGSRLVDEVLRCEANTSLANRFHRAGDCGLIKPKSARRKRKSK